LCGSYCKVYVGVYGLQTSAYDITVTQKLLPGAASSGPVALNFATAYSESVTANLVSTAILCIGILMQRYGTT
jgi:hypothetical protein